MLNYERDFFILLMGVILLMAGVIGSVVVLAMMIIYAISGTAFSVPDSLQTVWSICWMGGLSGTAYAMWKLRTTEDEDDLGSPALVAGEGSQARFFVRGGIYRDLTFADLVPGSEETYGPLSAQEALDLWCARSRFMVDTACHRLVIVAA